MIERFTEFKTLASRLNFTRAAAELNMSEPTLSKHVAALEREVGACLIERSPVALTPAGACFLEGFSQIVNEIDVLFEKCRHLAEQSSGELTIVSMPYRGTFSRILNRSIVQVSQMLPGVAVRFENSRDTTVAQAVVIGDADVGFIPCEESGYPGVLEADPICRQRFVVFLNRENPLSQRPIRFEELAGCTCVTSTNRKLWVLDDSARRICRMHGFEPSFKVREFDIVSHSLINMQADEMFIASEEFADLGQDNPNLVVADIEDGGDMTYPTYMITRIGEENPAVEALRRVLKTAVEHDGKALGLLDQS